MLSEEAKEELRRLSQSEAFRKDMETVRANSHNPFVKEDGTVDVDAYFEFLDDYNEFINHEPKLFRRMIDKDMRL
jgi:hypothetical protein